MARNQPEKARSIALTLANSIERQIANGAYKPGDKLPSLRELAQLHGHAKNTVVTAFEHLVARGLIQAQRGSGFYVAEATGPTRSEHDESTLSRAMDTVWLMREQLQAHPMGLAVGDGFPPEEWLREVRLDKHHQNVVRTGFGSLLRYGSRFGYAPLRDRLARKLADFGIDVEARQLVLTHGANDALDLVVRYFVPPGGKVLTDEPGYYVLYGKLKIASAQVLGVPRLADGPDLDALEQLLITHRPRIFFTQSLAHNPTGSDISPAKAFRLLQLAQKYDLRLVENDPFADFKPTGSTRLSALDQLERTIYIGSFSKSFSPSLRVGFVACSPDLASDLADLKALIQINSSEYCERLMDVILSESHYQRHLYRLRHRLVEATGATLSMFDSIGAEVFARNRESLYLWVAFPGVPDTLVLAKALLANNVVMAPGRIFSVDPTEISRWTRINVGIAADPRFAQALRRVLQEMYG